MISTCTPSARRTSTVERRLAGSNPHSSTGVQSASATASAGSVSSARIASSKRPSGTVWQRTATAAYSAASSSGRPVASMLCTATTRSSVSVPVLSRHSTSAAPRSCTALSRVTITCSAARRRAPRASVVVTMTGSISGVSPTATAAANSPASDQFPVTDPLTTSTIGTMTSMNRINVQLTERTPMSNADSGRDAAALRVSRPRVGRGPGGDHDPGGGPRDDGGPGQAQCGRALRIVALPVGIGRLRRGQPFAGEDALVHTQVAAGDDADIGRHHVPRTQEHHVAGHALLERDLAAHRLASLGSPPAHRHRRDHPGAQRAHRPIGTRLLPEAQQDRRGRHHPERHRAPRLPGDDEHDVEADEQPEEGAAQRDQRPLPDSEPGIGAHHVLAMAMLTAGDLVLEEPPGGRAEHPVHLVRRCPRDLAQRHVGERARHVGHVVIPFLEHRPSANARRHDQNDYVSVPVTADAGVGVRSRVCA